MQQQLLCAKQGSHVPDSCNVEEPEFLGDGHCDFYVDDGYNTPQCDYDMGDCCKETCKSGVSGRCDYFECLDPRFFNARVGSCKIPQDEHLIADKDTVNVGERATFNCQKGYALVGELGEKFDEVTRYCEEGRGTRASWDLDLPTCQVKEFYCPLPGQPDHGKVTPTGQTVEDHATIACYKGYATTAAENTYVLQCRKGSTDVGAWKWIGSKPECLPIGSDAKHIDLDEGLTTTASMKAHNGSSVDIGVVAAIGAIMVLLLMAIAGAMLLWSQKKKVDPGYVHLTKISPVTVQGEAGDISDGVSRQYTTDLYYW